ncbi:alpha/beta hydrolase [Streptomyces sp. NPDC055709]
MNYPKLAKWRRDAAQGSVPLPGVLDSIHHGHCANLSKDIESADTTIRANAGYVRKSIETVRHAGYEAKLWAYDPKSFNGAGRAALVIGDLENADFVAVLVPGTGNNLSWLPNRAENTCDLYKQCLDHSDGANVAIMYWMGYQAPSNLVQAGMQRYATAGKELLLRDVAELKEMWRTSSSRRSRGLPAQPRLTVSGHSYGSTTVGLAASRQPGLADALVLLGSPGVSVNRAEDLGVGENVFVGASNMDGVTYLQRYGVDPAHKSFGATRFRAHYTGPDQNPATEHQHYYDSGGQSIQNISRVVLGRTHELAVKKARTQPPLRYGNTST